MQDAPESSETRSRPAGKAPESECPGTYPYGASDFVKRYRFKTCRFTTM